MTRGDDHVVEHEADNDEDQGQTMDKVQKSIAVGKIKRNPRKPSSFATNMIVAYALPIVGKAISTTYREAKVSLKSKMWDPMMEEMSSLHKNDT